MSEPLSPFGQKIFTMALDMAPKAPPAHVVSQLQQSVIAELIAKLLADAACWQANIPLVEWETLSVEVRNRYSALAERAILSIDPSVRERAMERAAKETADWLAGPYAGRGSEPSLHDVARQVVHTYEAILSASQEDQ